MVSTAAFFFLFLFSRYGPLLLSSSTVLTFLPSFFSRIPNYSPNGTPQKL